MIMFKQTLPGAFALSGTDLGSFLQWCDALCINQMDCKSGGSPTLRILSMDTVVSTRFPFKKILTPCLYSGGKI